MATDSDMRLDGGWNVTQADREAAAQFMFECSPLLGDCCMKNSVELALRQSFARQSHGMREALLEARVTLIDHLHYMKKPESLPVIQKIDALLGAAPSPHRTNHHDH